ncbi:MAG: hypothetical protein ACXAEN_23785 [Candidatus Thorarchaeota archaeon]|jgi:hypothetical protein
MGNRITSDTTGEVLQSDEATSFKASLIVRVEPSGLEAISLQTPPIMVRRTSQDIVDNAEYQAFLADLAIVTSAISAKWQQFWDTYRVRLQDPNL